MFSFPSRWYQDEAEAAIYSYFGGNNGNPLIALPTGTGKSVVIANFVIGVFRRWPNQTMMMLTHRKELIGQNAAKLKQMWPGAPIGIFSAGLKDKTYWMPITFGGIQSVAKSIELFGHIDLLLVDEAHMIPPKQEGTYNEVIEYLTGKNPKLKVIGFTATAYRQRQGMLTDEGLFTDIIYDLTDKVGFNTLIEQGFLCKPIAKATATQIDVSSVKIQAGEFNQKQLEAAVDKEAITRSAVNEIIQYGANRWSWLVFSTSIEHAEHIAAMMQERGVACECVHSKLGDKINDERIDAFKRGELRCLVNNDKLTTGFDHPPVDLIGMIRHTQSTSLWVQMVGRGTRPYDWNNPGQYIPGFDFSKNDCLVLDFAKNSERLGPINDPVIPRKPNASGGDMPVKICPSCGVYNFPAARFCDNCGHEFPFSMHIEANHDSKAIILATDEPVIERLHCVHAAYKKYQRDPSSMPMLMVSYMCSDYKGVIRQNVLFEHSGYARTLAEKWFKERHAGEVPLTVDEALKYYASYKCPRVLTVQTNLKYPEIKSVEF